MKALLTLLLLTVFASSYASQKALTDTGEEVILNSDGTWEYVDGSHEKSVVISTNKELFQKPEEASFLLKSKTNDTAFWFNPQKWSFTKGKNNPDAEYEFELKNGDLYGVAVTEGIEVPLEALGQIALSNARDHAPDARIVKQEYRIVNGNRLLYMQINFSMHGAKFTYMSYYYSDDSGSTQLITYTSTNLADKYRPEAERFLNGLVTR